MTALLTTAYWPNLHYFYYVLNADTLLIEQHENYQRQSLRNRCAILSANGLLHLSIPMHKRAVKEGIADIAISYSENWQIRHWRAIVSAYKNSPYFDYFEEEIHYFYEQHFEKLLDYNTAQLKLLLRLLKQKKELGFTTEFKKEQEQLKDLRYIADAKTDFRKDAAVISTLEKPYYQTFSVKFPFQPNLSFLDLLFNTGLESLTYLSPGASAGN